MQLAFEDLRKLYLEDRKSAGQIARLLKCSEHKVNYWLTKYGIEKRSISEAVYAYCNPNGDPFLIHAPENISEGKLFGLGLGLYWGEGNKRNLSSIRLGNTDPRLINIFISFLEKFYNIKRQKLRFGLQIFSDMSIQNALIFWQKELEVPRAQFQKVIVTPSRGVGTYRNKTKYGVLTVHYNNKKLRNIICQTIENM